MWVKLDDGFAENPKILHLTVPARWLYLAGLIYAGRNLTDGLLRSSVIPRLADFKGLPDVDLDALVDELFVAGLWVPTDNVTGDVQIHHFTEYNPTRKEVLEERRLRSIAGVKGARIRWHLDESGDVSAEPIANAMAPAITHPMATPTETLMPRPDPTRPVLDPALRTSPGREQQEIDRTTSPTSAGDSEKRKPRSDMGRRHLRRGG